MLLSNNWQREAVNPTFTVSPTLILESPSVSTTRGSPSFSKYRNVPEPSFSTTKTLLSQLASPSWLTNKCSGLIPNVTESPFDEFEEVFGIVILDVPKISISVESFVELTIFFGPFFLMIEYASFAVSLNFASTRILKWFNPPLYNLAKKNIEDKEFKKSLKLLKPFQEEMIWEIMK